MLIKGHGAAWKVLRNRTQDLCINSNSYTNIGINLHLSINCLLNSTKCGFENPIGTEWHKCFILPLYRNVNNCEKINI